MVFRDACFEKIDSDFIRPEGAGFHGGGLEVAVGTTRKMAYVLSRHDGSPDERSVS